MFDGWIRDFAQWTPRAPAVITPARTADYAQFDADIDRFGAGLAPLGVRPGCGVVSVCLDDPYLTCVAIGALARLGIPSSPYHDPGADLRLVQDRPDAGSEAPGPRLIVLDGAWEARMRAAAPDRLPVLTHDPEAVGRVMLSSGTTRVARRIAIRWRRMQALNMANLVSRCAGCGGAWVSLTTVEAIQGFTLAVSAWSQGAALVAGYQLADLPALIQRVRPELLASTPLQLRALLDILPRSFPAQPQMRITIGGSRLPPELARQARMRLTPDVRVTYGATESPLITHGQAADLDDDPRLMGIPYDGAVVTIADDEGNAVPEGQSGEIIVHGPRVAEGYLDDEDATRERFREGGFATRDIGRRLADGRIVLEGRVDDRMNLGGRKVMPAVIEEAALGCPGVTDAAAFAVPEPATGLEACWLAVVAGAGFDRSRLAPHLAAFADMPELSIAWVSEIPRNAMGKIERTKLRDALVAATRSPA